MMESVAAGLLIVIEVKRMQAARAEARDGYSALAADDVEAATDEVGWFCSCVIVQWESAVGECNA